MRVLIAIFATAAALCAPTFAQDPPLAVIIHPSRTEMLSVDDVAQIFLKKRRFWGDRSQIVPLNRSAECAAREEFARLVLGLSAERQATYWNEQYFHGRFPPVTLSSDAAVKEYVAHDRNAIGYIDADDVDSSVRVVLILGQRTIATSTPTWTPPLATTPVWSHSTPNPR